MSDLDLAEIREAIAAKLKAVIFDCNVYAYPQGDGQVQLDSIEVDDADVIYHDTFGATGGSLPSFTLRVTVAPPAGAEDARREMDGYRSCGTPHSIYDALMDSDRDIGDVIRGDLVVLSSTRPETLVQQDGREVLRSEFPLLILHRKG